MKRHRVTSRYVLTWGGLMVGMVSGLTTAGCESFSSCSEARTCTSAPTSGENGGASGAGTGVAGGSGSVMPEPPPPGPRASISFGIKSAKFDWASVNAAEFYRVERQIDGVWTPVSADLQTLGERLTIGLHLFDWSSTLFRVAACNAGGCAASSVLDLAPAATQSVGFFKPPTTASGYGFGTSVALSADGKTLAVGGPAGNCEEGVGTRGAVLIFSKDEEKWEFQQCLQGLETDPTGGFGSSLALSADGKRLIVGAPFATIPYPNPALQVTGAAYVFEREGEAWSPGVLLKMPSAVTNAEFGVSVALADDQPVYVVGAHRAPVPSTPPASPIYSGLVYVFAKTGGEFGTPVTVSPPFVDAGDRFGAALAMSADGQRLLVGAPLEDGSGRGAQAVPSSNGSSNSGAAFVYVSSGAGWTLESYLKAANADAGDQFGGSVAMDEAGTTVAIGAPHEASAADEVDGAADDNSAPGAGAVYVFELVAKAWVQASYLKAVNSAADHGFSRVTLSADGNVLAVGAPGETSGGAGANADLSKAAADDGSETGAAYVYVRAQGAWTHKSFIKALEPRSSDAFGAVGLSGDGQTLVVGASKEKSRGTGVGANPADDGASASGAAYLY